jgi:hypothetical protein
MIVDILEQDIPKIKKAGFIMGKKAITKKLHKPIYERVPLTTGEWVTKEIWFDVELVPALRRKKIKNIK